MYLNARGTCRVSDCFMSRSDVSSSASFLFPSATGEGKGALEKGIVVIKSITGGSHR